MRSDGVAETERSAVEAAVGASSGSRRRSAIARRRSRGRGPRRVGYYPFTSLINRHFSADDKERIVDCCGRSPTSRDVVGARAARDPEGGRPAPPVARVVCRREAPRQGLPAATSRAQQVGSDSATGSDPSYWTLITEATACAGSLRGRPTPRPATARCRRATPVSGTATPAGPSATSAAGSPRVRRPGHPRPRPPRRPIARRPRRRGRADESLDEHAAVAFRCVHPEQGRGGAATAAMHQVFLDPARRSIGTNMLPLITRSSIVSARTASRCPRASAASTKRRAAPLRMQRAW